MNIVSPMPQMSGEPSLSSMVRGQSGSLWIRPAKPGDVETIKRMARRSVDVLLGAFLTGEQMAGTDDFIELDPWLIDDGTYYVAELEGRILGSGGWSFRRGLVHGAKASFGRDEALIPGVDAARIRAMYTDPDHARRGIGRMLLSVCETAARLAGFTRAELLATPAGEKLYRTCGWQIDRRDHVTTRSDIEIPVMFMSKRF